MRLNGRTALITGAASGIGKQIALAFAREGARVAAADIAPQAAAETAAFIKAQGGEAIALSMDVAVERDVNEGVASVAALFGGIDILVSNAGTQIVRPIEELTFDEWKGVLGVHLDGAFLTTKACLPLMKSSGRGGAIIYMGSVHSKEGSPLKAPPSACARMSSARDSFVRRWWTDKFRSKRLPWGSPNGKLSGTSCWGKRWTVNSHRCRTSPRWRC